MPEPPVPVFLEDPTLTQFAEASRCFRCLSNHEKNALTIWLMTQCTRVLDDEDWTDIHKLSAAVSCFKCEPDSVLRTFVIWTFYQLAVAISAIPAMSVGELRAAIKCWACADDKLFRAAFPFMLNHLVEAALPEPPD